MVYFKFYMQKEGLDTSGSAYPVKESGSSFHVYEKESKFYGGRELKEPAKREWHDENGDDEFLPSKPVYKAQEVEIQFACKGEIFSSNKKLKDFIDYLANSGSMKIYDEYNGIARRNVRFVSVSDATLYRKRKATDEALVFTVKLKINDPVTDVTIETDSNGNVTNLKSGNE